MDGGREREYSREWSYIERGRGRFLSYIPRPFALLLSSQSVSEYLSTKMTQLCYFPFPLEPLPLSLGGTDAVWSSEQESCPQFRLPGTASSSFGVGVGLGVGIGIGIGAGIGIGMGCLAFIICATQNTDANTNMTSNTEINTTNMILTLRLRLLIIVTM